MPFIIETLVNSYEGLLGQFSYFPIDMIVPKPATWTKPMNHILKNSDSILLEDVKRLLIQLIEKLPMTTHQGEEEAEEGENRMQLPLDTADFYSKLCEIVSRICDIKQEQQAMLKVLCRSTAETQCNSHTPSNLPHNQTLCGNMESISAGHCEQMSKEDRCLETTSLPHINQSQMVILCMGGLLLLLCCLFYFHYMHGKMANTEYKEDKFTFRGLECHPIGDL